MAPDDSIEALVVSVNQSIQALESQLTDTQVSLDGINEKLKGYVPRKEADAKAKKVKKMGIIGAGITTIAFTIGGGLWYDNHRDTDRLTQNCRENRDTLKQVIEIAVADRPVLSTSTPETAAAINELNERSVRPLRNRLLSLEGTQPEKC